MNKIVLLLLVLFISTISMAKSKPFPRKYVGVYTGTQGSYILPTDNGGLVTVEQGRLVVILEFNQMSLQVGKRKLDATFEVTAKTKEYYALKVTFSNGVIENWSLYRKQKKILRKPVYPIPETFLFKK